MAKTKRFAFHCIRDTNTRDFVDLNASHFFGSIKKGQYVALSKHQELMQGDGFSRTVTILENTPMFRPVKSSKDAYTFNRNRTFLISEWMYDGKRVMDAPLYDLDNESSPDAYLFGDFFEIVEIVED